MSPSNHENNHAPKLEPQLEAAVWSLLAEPIDQDAIRRIKARALALPESSNTVAVSIAAKPSRWNRFAVKLMSVAAGIAVLVGGSLFLQPSQSAFAAALQQLLEARSFTFVNQIFVEGKAKPIETKVMVAENGRQRQEHTGGVVTISDTASMPRLTLLTDSKTALRQAGQNGETAKHDQLAWLNDLKSHRGNPDEQLGRKNLDGQSVDGFVVKQGIYKYTVWVDAGTKELVAIEFGPFVKGSTIKKVVIKDFRFNVALDESLFSIDVPDGYQVVEQPAIPKVVLELETNVVEALRGFTKQSKGRFPKSITEWGEWAVLFSQASTDGKLTPETNKILGYLGSITSLLVGKPNTDYAYFGNGKTVDDPRCIVFWFRSEEKTLRAIYNDLTVATIEAKDLP